MTALLLWATLVGCDGDATPTVPGPAPAPIGNATPAPLQILVVDDKPLGEAIARRWKAQTETTIAVRDFHLAELQTAQRLPGDIVIFPSGQLGELAERGLVLPLDEAVLAGSQFDRRDLFDLIRRHDILWGNRTLAVPLGSPQLLLVCRRDLLDQAGVASPQTWEEYQNACRTLADKLGSSVHPTIEPLADGWAGRTLLARAATYVTHRDQLSPLLNLETLEPLLESAPYVRALTELVAASKHFSTAEPLTPEQALAQLAEGKAAMALTWISPTGNERNSNTVVLEASLTPGSQQVFNFATKSWEDRDTAESQHAPLLGVSGRLAAVSSSTANFKKSQDFLVWLATSETSAAVCPASASTTLFRQSHWKDASRWAAGLSNASDYAETVQKSQSLPRFVSLRLPGRERYLAALDAAVQSAVAGEKTPEVALADATIEWSKVTGEVGREAQKQALNRDLGILSLQ
jgi:multiple sugar transport system substrate-binding protein